MPDLDDDEVRALRGEDVIEHAESRSIERD
jgi:hypothetical protein